MPLKRRQGRKRRNIRSTLVQAVLLLTMLPITLFGVLISIVNTWRVEATMKESMQIAANLQLKEIESFRDRVMENMMMLGQTQEVKELMRGERDVSGIAGETIEGVIASRVAITSYVESVTLLDKDMQVLVCSKHIDKQFAHDAIRENETIRSGQIYFSDVVTAVEDGKETKEIFCTTGIFEDGELLGYVLEELNLSFYDAIRKDENMWKGATVYILDSKGEIITAGTSMNQYESFVTSPEEREDYQRKYRAIDFEKEPSGHIEYRVSGLRYITYYSNIEHTGWRFMLSVNISQYQQQTELYIILVVVLLSTFLVLTMWLDRFIARRILRPMNLIAEDLRKLQEEQDYSCRVAVQTDDEMGKLTAEVNGLLEYIERESLYEKQKRRELQEKAEHDALTQALNREAVTRALEEALECYRETGEKFAVLFIDVDDFKDFNSRYGHAVGDQVLLYVTKVIRTRLKGAVGRIGGDEFLSVVRDKDVLSRLEPTLRETLDELSTTFRERGSGVHLPVSCSIGVSIPTRPDITAEEMIAESDKHMYYVKDEGKKGFHI